MPTHLHHLPEPTTLHAHLTTHHPLDWGPNIPTKAEIAAKYGTDATIQSLTLLARAAVVERESPTTWWHRSGPARPHTNSRAD